MLGTVQSINLSEVPDEFQDWLWQRLPINGGNVISVDEGEPFSKWLVTQGFVFKKAWGWLVVFR